MQGPFSKIDWRRGTGNLGPLDRRWTAVIGSGKEERKLVAETVADGNDLAGVWRLLTGAIGENTYGLN